MGADLTATFTLEGDEELIDKIRRLFPIYSQAAEDGAWDWGQDVMNVSKRDYVPVDTGSLKASGYAEAYTGSGGDWLEVNIGFPKDYAAPVHERMGVRHEVGQAKYLEIPLIIKSGELLPRIAQKMERAAEAEL